MILNFKKRVAQLENCDPMFYLRNLRSSASIGGLMAFELRDLDVHQRRVLLAAVAVGIVRVALGRGARDRGLDGEGVVAEEEFHNSRRQLVRRGHCFATGDRSAPNIVCRLCMSFLH